MFSMTVPLVPDEGWGVLHLFCKVTPRTDAEAITRAVKAAEEAGQQVICFAVLGHKADLAFMLVGPTWWRCAALKAPSCTRALTSAHRTYR